MPDNAYSTALVTGASSGIGAAVTRALQAAGIQVYALARSREPLQALAEEVGSTPLVVDVNDTARVDEAIADLAIDVVVNNAGLGRGYDGLAQATDDDIERVINTNVAAVLKVTRTVMRGMIERHRGHIVNLSSIAGLHPTGFALYAASKGATHLLSQNLRLELRGTGVRVTEICPGRVETPYFEKAMDDPARAASFTAGLTCLRPEDIADAIVYAVRAPWHCNVSTIELQPTEQTVGGTQVDQVN